METIIIENILRLISMLGNFYLFLMFVMAIMSILGMTGVINIFGDGYPAKIFFFLNSLIQPPLQFISRFVPRVGMLDLPFLVLLLLLWIIVDLCDYYINMLHANSFSF